MQWYSDWDEEDGTCTYVISDEVTREDPGPHILELPAEWWDVCPEELWQRKIRLLPDREKDVIRLLQGMLGCRCRLEIHLASSTHISVRILYVCCNCLHD